MIEVNKWVFLNTTKDSVINYAIYNWMNQLELELHFTEDHGCLLTVHSVLNPESVHSIDWHIGETMIQTSVDWTPEEWVLTPFSSWTEVES